VLVVNPPVVKVLSVKVPLVNSPVVKVLPVKVPFVNVLLVKVLSVKVLVRGLVVETPMVKAL